MTITISKISRNGSGLDRGRIKIGEDIRREHISGDDDRPVEISQQGGSELSRGYGTGGDGGIEIGQYAGGKHGAGDGSGLDGFCKVCQICHLGGKGVGSGGDALVGLKV